MPFFDPQYQNFRGIQEIENRSYVCGFCDHRVSSDRGYKVGYNRDASGHQVGGIYICPNCQGPTFFSPGGRKYPGNAAGNEVTHVPEKLADLYEEARRCTSENCHTAAVLLCRKMLMNIAVEQGAKAGLPFIEYVNFLSENGYTPPNGKHWVDHIRKKGNEATHEIALMTSTDARDLIVFTEMLLRFIYEFPSMVTVPEGA